MELPDVCFNSNSPCDDPEGRKQRLKTILRVIFAGGLLVILLSYHNSHTNARIQTIKERHLFGFSTRQGGTDSPTFEPTVSPSKAPSPAPTVSSAPTLSPQPSYSPTVSMQPTISKVPTAFLSKRPTTNAGSLPQATAQPTFRPASKTAEPTLAPTLDPNPGPTAKPTRSPVTPEPTLVASQATPKPSPDETLQLTLSPSQDSRQEVAPTTASGPDPTPCSGDRNVVKEYYYIFFEEFDTSIVSDAFLENAFRNAYNSNSNIQDCEPEILDVDRIEDATPQQRQETELLVYTERIEFLVTSSQIDDAELFPTPIVRATFVSALNEFFAVQQLPIYTLNIKDSPGPSEAPSFSPGAPTPVPTLGPPPVPTPRPSSQITRRPTTEPTTEQPVSSQPTRAPSTPNPSPAPNPRPTSQITRRPTTQPTTKQPVSGQPTRTPSTQNPSPAPTAGPTDSQLGSSTLFPTLGPSREPTEAPSLTSSMSPSEAPTVTRVLTQSPQSNPRFTLQPTANRPTTPFPSLVPTETPSSPPSASPTLQPTFTPSSPPTNRPSTSPTNGPTGLPSSRPSRWSYSPTQTPSSRPSGLPSTSPTLVPTDSPTLSVMPSVSPSDMPSEPPSGVPSASPSEPPEYILREPELNSVQMILEGVSLLSSRSQTVWSEATETAIQDEVTTILNNQVESVDVEVTINSQNPRRRLQGASIADSPSTVISSNLTIVFDVKFFIRAVIEDHNVRRYVGASLDTAGDQDIFILQLKSSGETAFQNLTSVRLILPPLGDENAIRTDGDSESLSTGVTVGITTVSIAGIALIGMGLFMWMRRTPAQSQSSSEQVVKNLREFEADGVMVDVLGKPDMDVSTLGDPIPQGVPAAPADSLDEETPSLPYDYKVASHTLPSLLDESASYSFSEVSSNIVDVQTDDDTLDAQYFIEDRIEVEAPPGMLGLVLEADSEGVAAVCNMKEASPLADRVHIGDKLVSVDGVDVTAMPVGSVMKLIASKQDNKVRGLAFSRPSRKAIHRDDDSREVDT